MAWKIAVADPGFDLRGGGLGGSLKELTVEI